MKYNQIHDTQRAFRDILKAFSYPGTIVEFLSYLQKLDTGLQDMTYIFGSVFLDQEVTYYRSRKTNTFEDIFYSKQASLHDADFVFLHALDMKKDIYATLKQGTLIDPHKSALLFIEVDTLSKKHDYELTGPGIKTPQPFSLENNNALLEDYINTEFEYPLGIDLIFYTKDSMVAIPRTTTVKKVL